MQYNVPEVRNKVQAELDHAVALLSIAHVMTIFEDNFPYVFWEDILGECEDYFVLRACRHIRNCSINGFTGQRTRDDDSTYFDNVMESDAQLKGIKEFNEEQFSLTESAGNYIYAFLSRLTDEILVKVHRRLADVR